MCIRDRYAAMEMEREITLKYQYTDTFLPSDEVQQKSKEWYEDGVQAVSYTHLN